MKKLFLTMTLCALVPLLTGCGCDHRLTATVTKGETCTETGLRQWSCTHCDKTWEEVLPRAEHQGDFYSLNPGICIRCGEETEAADPENPWYGREWAAIGTSITSEEYGNYVNPLAQRSGMQATNLGVPGATVSQEILDIAREGEFLSQMDLITVEFGTNDWYQNVPLGEVGDTEPLHPKNQSWKDSGSFAGGCYRVFRTLQEQAPGARIVYLTTPAGSYQDSEEHSRWDRKNGLGLRQRDYYEMAMAVAAHMGIPVIDAGAGSQINEFHPDFYADEIHHSQLGGKQYALTVWLELENISPLLQEEYEK